MSFVRSKEPSKNQTQNYISVVGGVNTERKRHENRARVVFNLPLNDAGEEAAVSDIIEYLREQRVKGLGVEGFTHSDPSPTVFHGWWWGAGDEGAEEMWVHDDLVMFVVDFLTFSGEQNMLSPLSKEIADLKKKILDSYRNNGCEQDEVWIVFQKATRYA